MALLIEIKVPDVGNVADIDVVDVLVKSGDRIKLEQTLAVLETDKASIDLPSSAAGRVQEIFIKPGDKVSEGTLIATVLADAEELSPSPVAEPTPSVVERPALSSAEGVNVEKPEPAALQTVEKVSEPVNQPIAVIPEAMPPTLTSNVSNQAAHATPAVRLFARELGVDIHKITSGSGRKGRILKDDVRNFVKHVMAQGTAQNGSGSIPAMPSIDFSQFGAIEEQKLSKT